MGHFTGLKKRSKIFQDATIFMDLKTEKIFAKGAQDFLGCETPLDQARIHGGGGAGGPCPPPKR